MDNPQKYRDGHFNEELELLASMQRSVEIVFRSENGARTVIRDRIAGLFVQEGLECIRTGGGLVIGVDRLEEVDGLRPLGDC